MCNNMTNGDHLLVMNATMFDDVTNVAICSMVINAKMHSITSVDHVCSVGFFNCSCGIENGFIQYLCLFVFIVYGLSGCMKCPHRYVEELELLVSE